MKALIAIAGLVLTGLIVWAVIVGDFSAAGDFLLGKPWGIVAMADLYLGFLLIALVIYLVEPDTRIALAWIVPIFVLGNIVTVLWFVLRGFNQLRAVFRKQTRS